MTKVRFEITRETPTGRVQVYGPIECSPSVRRVIGGVVVTPEPFTVVLREGEDPPEIDMAPTTDQWVWVMRENFPHAAEGRRSVEVPDTSEVVKYGDLVEVDPASREPIVKYPSIAELMTMLEARFAPGGTTGQVLSKLSDADHDTYWRTVSGGGGGGPVEDADVAAIIRDPATETRTLLDQEFATAAQGSKADTAVQPAALDAEAQARQDGDTALADDIARKVDADDLGSAAAQDIEAFATAAQGVKADQALPASALPAALAGKANTADLGTAAGEDVAAFATAAQGAKADSAVQPDDLQDKADLVGGKVPTSQIPAIALTRSVQVEDEAEMLALTPEQVQPGDIAVRGDGAGTFMLDDPDPSVLSSWMHLNAPTDMVSSVNGHTGTVVLGRGDIGLPNVNNTSDVNKPVSTAQQAAINAAITAAAGGYATAAQGGRADTAVQPTRTVAGKPLSDDVTLDKDDVGLSQVDNTADADKPVSTAQAQALAGKVDGDDYVPTRLVTASEWENLSPGVPGVIYFVTDDPA